MDLFETGEDACLLLPPYKAIIIFVSEINEQWIEKNARRRRTHVSKDKNARELSPKEIC